MAKPRVIISTDIGGSDPDDMESMAHALLASDQWDIKALISTPTKHEGRASDIHEALDAYAKDYGNLKTWSSGYPTPDYLKSVVYQGNVNVAPSAGYSSPTAGSKAIIEAAHDAKAAGEPLWVMTWGALTDVAQALHDDPSIRPTLRVLSSNGWNKTQDPNAFNYVLGEHAENGLWMIDSHSTHRGIYINAEGKEGNPFQMNEAKGHGALGDYFYEARPWGVKMGDSWSIAYLTDKANNNDPGADSWGGEFVKSGLGPNYWTDDPSSAAMINGYKGAQHVREHQGDIYKDMYRLFDRAKAQNPDADSATPPPVEKDSPVRIMPLGDSHTYGIVGSYTDRESGGYRKYLTEKLKDAGIAFDMVGRKESGPSTFDNDHEGYSGYHIQQLTSMVKDMMAANKPDVILLMAGSNDSYSDSVSTMKSDMGKLIDTISSHAPNAQLLIAGIPPARPENSPGMDPAVISGFNAALPGLIAAKASAGKKVTFVDTSSLTLSDVSSMSVDNGVHLTHSGHQELAGIWLNAIKKLNDGTTSPTPAPDPDSSSGGNNAVYAVDDTKYKLDPGKTLWENARYLTWNDKGADGGLHVTQVDKTSAQGVTVSWDANGTIAYKAKAGFVGTDTIGYTVVDKDGSSDTAKMVITVGNPGSQPAPAPEPEPDTSAGSGNPVNAVDDTKYKLDSGKTLWENSRYLTWNDKGADGGLKVTQVDKTSAQGVSVSWDETGTIVYKAKAGFVGTDTIGYTVVDKDGSSDSANMVITVGSGSSSPAPAPAPAPTPSAGSGNGVTAVDDSYSAQAGKTLWMNSRYFMFNDKGADGGLDVKSVDKVTAKGVDISSWGPEGSAQDGTIAYKAPSNFSGTDSFQYTLVDQDGSADVGTVFVNVVDMFG